MSDVGCRVSNVREIQWRVRFTGFGMNIRRPTSDIRQSSPAYWHFSQRPLQSLVFLFPLILLYELGTRLYAHDAASGATTFIYARSLLRDFFEWFGVTGYYLPGLIVVVVLLSWHVVRRDPWDASVRQAVLMWFESVLLALPLFVFMLVLVRPPTVHWALAAPTGEATSWQAQLVFSIGAGIYEELLFRLIAIALLHLLLVDVLAMPERLGAGLSIGLSALAFALYHFPSLEAFDLARCLFYTAAGIYFAGVYVLRGFGIVVGCHAMYDVLVVIVDFTQRS